MPRRLVWAVLVLALIALTLPASSGALDLNGFQPARGQGTLALSLTLEGYDEFWVGETKVSDPGVGEVETSSITAWFMWGFTDDLALVVNVPYVDTDSDGLGNFSDSGLQDLTALLRYRFLNVAGGGSRHGLTGAVGLRTPISDYEANLPVDLGDGTDDGLLRLVYQFERDSFYFSQQVGYDRRGGDAPDGIPLYTELGVTAGRATFSAFYARLIADGGTDIGDPGFTFPSNQDEYSRAGGKVYLRFSERFGAALSYFTTLDGRNSGDADGLSLSGVWGF
jgi:hypothetical protein